MPDSVKQAFPHMIEDNQLIYSRFKLAVAQVLKPRTIFETGIGWGVSARAFLVGYPDTQYYGIDSGVMGVPPDVVLPLQSNVQWQGADLNSIAAYKHPAGNIDLIHIDGDHSYNGKTADVIKALEARPEWILIDDMHDCLVAAGTYRGLYKAAKNYLHMIYFENSGTDSLLIHVGRLEPEYRELPI